LDCSQQSDLRQRKNRYMKTAAFFVPEAFTLLLIDFKGILVVAEDQNKSDFEQNII